MADEDNSFLTNPGPENDNSAGSFGTFKLKKPSMLAPQGNNKRPIQLSISPAVRQQFEEMTDEAKLMYSGVGNAKTPPTDVPNYIAAEAEDIISNGNSWIVLGKDRPGTIGDGFGGLGNTHCAAIDLVAGRMGGRATQMDAQNEAVYVNPNFTMDAARIYISQKSDIDHYLDLRPGTVGNTTYLKPASAVALKADAIRIVGREGIKLVTCTDVENSQTGDVNVNAGIDLIANNDDEDMQPLVKGDYLVSALQEIFIQINDTREILYNFLATQKDFNREIMSHTHHSPFFGILTSPSPAVLAQGVKNMIDIIKGAEVQCYNHLNNSNMAQLKYAKETGAAYVLSKYNHTN